LVLAFLIVGDVVASASPKAAPSVFLVCRRTHVEPADQPHASVETAHAGTHPAVPQPVRRQTAPQVPGQCMPAAAGAGMVSPASLQALPALTADTVLPSE
jgi:hypothetical protein